MKISERAKELFVASHKPADSALALKCLCDALDEWQASTEKRVTALIEVVNEIQLREVSGERLSAHLYNKSVSALAVPIADPGPSRYDEEPEDLAG